MSANDPENPRDDRLSDNEEPILLTDEVPGAEGNDDDIIDLTEEVSGSQGDGDVIDLVDVVEGGQAAANVSITPEQLDKALERTIEKIYGDRIESMLKDAVHRKVSAEIEKIKKTLRNV